VGLFGGVVAHSNLRNALVTGSHAQIAAATRIALARSFHTRSVDTFYAEDIGVVAVHRDVSEPCVDQSSCRQND
jgi:hypothetical protein